MVLLISTVIYHNQNTRVVAPADFALEVSKINHNFYVQYLSNIHRFDNACLGDEQTGNDY